MIQTCSITSTSTNIQTCNKIDYNPTPSAQNFPFTYPSGLFTISPSTCLATVSIIASYKNGAVATLPAEITTSFTSTGMNINLPNGNAATYNKVKGGYALTIRLSLSPTVYADAALYFKIFNSQGNAAA